MSIQKCTDPDSGSLMHAYEIGILTPDETEQFELHLMRCERCLSEANSVVQEMKAVREHADIQHLASSAIKKTSTDRPMLEKLRGSLDFRKPILAYLIILLLAYPAYLGLRDLQQIPTGADADSDKIRPVQLISLMPTRSSRMSTLDISSGLDGVVSFACPEFVPGEEYHLSVIAKDGSTVVDNPSYSGFNEFGMGEILIPHSQMEVGVFCLTITGRSADDAPVKCEYKFRMVQRP